MSSQYGIGVTRNRFELFDSDEDPMEVLKQAEIEKEQRKKKVTGKENSTTAKDSVKKPVVVRKTAKEIQSTRTVAVKKEAVRSNYNQGRQEISTGSRDRQSNFTGTKVSEDSRDEFSDSKFDKSVLRDGNGRSTRVSNRGRGGRGARTGFESRGKREFERHSGSDKTGVKCVDKKEGAGAFNWDSAKEMVKEIGENGNLDWNDKPEGTLESPEQTPQGENQGEEATVTSESESAREMTLDEWKAMRVPKAKPVHNLRKAGEGEDLSRWKKMYVLEKKNFEEEEEEEEYEHCDYPQRVGRQKHLLDIDIRFKDVRSTRGGRGRGGMGRGGGGAGPGRNISPRDPDKSNITKKEVPKVDNEHEFPSLG